MLANQIYYYNETKMDNNNINFALMNINNNQNLGTIDSLYMFDQNNNNNNNMNNLSLNHLINRIDLSQEFDFKSSLAIDCNFTSPASLSSSSSTNSDSVAPKNNTKINPFSSSSSDCLSSDEGYVGSYSDLYSSQTPEFHLQFQNQFFLLQYLLNNNYLLQQLSVQNQQSENSSLLLKQNIEEHHQEQIEIKIPNFFEHQKNDDLAKFELVNDDDDLYVNDYDWLTNKIFPNNYSNLDSSNLSHLQLIIDDDIDADIEDCFKAVSKFELDQLNCRLESEKLQVEKLEELDMLDRNNWRKIVDKRKQNEIIQQEFYQEDKIDLDAYLNEIDMNLDYVQLDPDYFLNNKHSVDLDLKFRSNKMAFNLRLYHKFVCEQYNKLNLNLKPTQKESNFSHMLANLHVDSIPEFVPFDEEQDFELDNYEFTMIEDETCYYETDTSPNQNHHDTTVINEPEQEYDLGEHFYYDYYNNNEEYDDQLMIDSLSEEEALNLLRNESELYALQMSQASKYGLLKEEKSKKKKQNKKSRFNSGNESQSESNNNKVDIFENVFNYEDEINEYLNEEEYNFYVENNFNDFNEFEFGSKISASLRSSLIKLLQKRRHLANLLELHTKSLKSANSNGSNTPTSTSTTSSLTTSNLSLYKQNLINQTSRKPCVYMLNEGRCMRADCRFVHDLKTIMCKYWLEGECLKGENCEFLHDHINEEQISSNKKSSFSSSFVSSSKSKKSAVVKKDFKLDTEEFPALGGSTENNKTPKQASPKSAKLAASVLLASVVKTNPAESKKKNSKAKNNSVNLIQVVSAPAKKSSSSEHKSREKTSSKPSTPVISISIKNLKQTNKANSCGSSITSSSSSTASSRANSKIRISTKK